MKTFIAAILLIASMASCKKEHIQTCERTMADVAGSFKLTKYELVSTSTGLATDYTYTFTLCELSGIYNLNADSTATYTEMAGCSGSGTGTWALNNVGLAISINASGNCNRINMTLIDSWDCTNLVLMTMYPGPAYQGRYTLTRTGD